MKHLARVLLAALVVVLAAAPSAPAAAAPSTHGPVRAGPAPLPASHLEFGLTNGDVTWMTSSGVPWRYRYTYLAGGVNTTNNWLTWQDLSLPPGQYALDYMSSSSAAPANYIPVFTWYQLLQSTPSTGSSELNRDYSNLNNASTMASYYASFKVLMQKAAQYGGQVVVHVEPDFWGYMQQKAAGAGATSISAMVKSSGFAEASSFPDSLVGFASELKYLRDTYAPNALLAMHASMWSSSIDIASDTRSSINAATEADKTAAFLLSAGAGSWGAVFNDVDDHDAAWWEAQGADNQYFTHWWDTNNAVFPNFTRYLEWVAELHAQTGKPQVVWQVPVGNQYYLTMNNTCGHYQDNVAAYFIAHPQALFSAGLVAVLFGAGNSCQTTNEDTRGDGITNNSGVPITDPLGGCSACNTHTSVYPDDDGGYLRTFVGAYYQSLAACRSASLAPATAAPQNPGASITFTASSTGCASPEYRYFIQAPGGSWTAQTGYTGATWTWNTSGLGTGTYGVGVWARDAGSSAAYEAYWIGTYTLSVDRCTAASLSTASGFSGAPGAMIGFQASTSGCGAAQFRFWLLPRGGSWTMVQDYGPGGWTWHTAGYASGTYEVGVWARQPGSSNSYDAYGITTFVLGTGTCSVAGMTTSATPPQAPGAAVSFTASSNSCAGALYQFWLLPPGGSWTVKQAYGASTTWAWNTSGYPSGTYQVGLWAKASTSSNSYDAYYIGTYQLDVGMCTSAGISAGPASPQPAGASITFTATSTGCSAPAYEFWLLPPPGTSWQVAQAYGNGSTFVWNAGSAAGPYRVGVWARQAGSTAGYDSYAIVTFWVT